jgi:hypothetical protein
MRSHVAAGVAFAVGCFITAGCHKAMSPEPWWASATIADLSREGQLRLAADIGAVCTAKVDFTQWDRHFWVLDFSKKGAGFVWFPDPPLRAVWGVHIPTAKPAGDWDENAINLWLSFEPPQKLPIVVGIVDATGLPVSNSQITVKMDPSHDLVSLSWWGSVPPQWNLRWSGECLARLPFRHAPP